MYDYTAFDLLQEELEGQLDSVLAVFGELELALHDVTRQELPPIPEKRDSSEFHLNLLTLDNSRLPELPERLPLANIEPGEPVAPLPGKLGTQAFWERQTIEAITKITGMYPHYTSR